MSILATLVRVVLADKSEVFDVAVKVDSETLPIELNFATESEARAFLAAIGKANNAEVNPIEFTQTH